MLITEISQSVLAATLPPLQSQEGIPDPIVHLKFVSDSGWVWFVTEGSPEGEDFIFFGFVVGEETEWGEFLLSELSEADPAGFPIKQDPLFIPGPLSKVRGESCTLQQ